MAGGKLALALAAGVAFTLAIPRMTVVHDRRPPGLDRAVGAADANAGLLHAADGWRVVVLPSLGDVAAGLGAGPVAIRADGRRVAAVRGRRGGGDGDLGDGADPVARRPGVLTPSATPTAASWPPPAPPSVAPGGEPAPGSPIVSLSAAAAGSRLVAGHEDGSVSVWEAGASEPLAAWPSPLPGSGPPALSPDGALVALGTAAGEAPAACLLRAEDGALARRVEGARAIALSPAGDGLMVGGDWGCAWLTPFEEDT